MANAITVTTRDLTSKAGELRKFNTDLKKKITDLETQEKNLNKMWDGEANDAFHKAFSNDVKQMDAFYKLIDKYVKNLEEIAKAYDKAEKANTQTASKRNYK